VACPVPGFGSVTMLLPDEEWAAWSDREIARRCAVGHQLVAAVRRSLDESSSEDTPPRTYTTKHGTEATMRTENIGRARDEPPRVDRPAAVGPLRKSGNFPRILALAAEIRRAGHRLVAVRRAGQAETGRRLMAIHAGAFLPPNDRRDSGLRRPEYAPAVLAGSVRWTTQCGGARREG